MRLDPAIAQRIKEDDKLWPEFEAICDCGGRLTGTESERRAVELVARLGSDASGSTARLLRVPYDGWTATRAELRLGRGEPQACHPLILSAATPADGLTAEVVDVGRGTPEDFEAHAQNLAGRIALVRHELMFAADTVHRSRKYAMARDRGAVGFLVAGPLDGSVVAGSASRFGSHDLPAMGISPETAARLARTDAGRPTATLVIETEEGPAEARNVMLELPGQTDEWIVLSAHIDGHEISESAMDNASGVAVALAATRCLAPEMHRFRRGLRVMFFTVEEWALTGSDHYVGTLSEAERDNIALNINLDSVAGSADLTALTSGFSELGPFLQSVAEANGLALRCHLPLMMNSDHANFAAAGIPAFRLVAGFDDPRANLRHVLTPADTRDKIAPEELRQASLLAAATVTAACNASSEEADGWRN